MNMSLPLSEQPEQIWGRILPASSQAIRSWSYGIVTSGRLLDYQSHRFNDAGLFSECIFGPISDWRCGCGKFAGAEHANIVCDQCGVVVGSRGLRLQRFGSIELRLPLLHPWWYGNNRRPVELLTALSARQLRAVLSRELAIDFGEFAANLNYSLVPIGRDEPVPPDLLIHRQSGAEAIRHLLWLLNGEQLERRLRQQFESGDAMDRQARRRLRLISMLSRNKVQPEDLTLEAIPVIPAGLRSIDLADDGKLNVDRLTRCYQRILKIDRAIRRLLDQTPIDCASYDADPGPAIRRLERRMRQTVARLFAAGCLTVRERQQVWRPGRRPLQRCSPRLEPLVAAVAPLVADPSLQLDQCRLPRDAARDLWKSRIISTLNRQRSLEQAVDDVKRHHPRAECTLDRLYELKPTIMVFPTQSGATRMMAMKTRPTDDGAIHIHPLMAAWLQLSFDGGQAVAWHTQGSDAFEELSRMSPAMAIRDVATGDVQLQLSVDARLGLYLATWESGEQRLQRSDMLGRHYDLLTMPPMFNSAEEARLAYVTGKCKLDSPAVLKLPRHQLFFIDSCDSPIWVDGSTAYCTTVGRALLNDLLPSRFPFFDLPFGRKEAEYVVARLLEDDGPYETMRTVERLARFAMEILTRSGISLSIVDFAPPATKQKWLAEAYKQVVKTDAYYERGILVRGERDGRILDVWQSAIAGVNNDLFTRLGEDPVGPLRVIGHVTLGMGGKQLQDLSGMVGPVWSTNHRYSLIPITRCYAEGLTSREYFMVARRARADRVDQVLKTRDARQLTQRLANVARNVVVTEVDCGASQGVFKRSFGSEDRAARPLAASIAGRVSGEAIIDPYSDETIVASSELILPAMAKRIESLGIERLEVRSPLTCDAKHGVCQRCYGADPRTGRPVALGTAVGTLAALAFDQSLPKLRIFVYRTGFAPRREEDGQVRALRSGMVMLAKVDLAVDRKGQRVALSAGVIEISDAKQRIVAQHDVPQGAVILPASGDQVREGEQIAQWNPHVIAVYAKTAGTVVFEDLTPGRNMQLDEQSPGPGVWRVHRWQYGKHPCLCIHDISGQTVDFCFLPKHSRLFAVPGQSVDRGTLLAELPAMREGTHDWFVGGIPRVEELLTARQPQRKAVLAEVDGRIEEITRTESRRCTIWIYPCDVAGNDIGDSIPHEIDMTRYGRIVVSDKDRVSAGDCLTDGDVSVRDLLRILGSATAGQFLLAELVRCFRGQPKPIDLEDRHIELIVGQMLGFARVESSGDTGLEVGDVWPRSKILSINQRLRSFLKIENQGDSFMPPGRLVSRYQFDQEVRRIERSAGQLPTYTIPWPASVCPTLLGIDEVALRRDSFLTSRGSSFDQRSLAAAALGGQYHNLSTVKDSIITAGLIPVGSGWKRSPNSS